MGAKSRVHWASGANVSEERWNEMFPFIYFYRREGEWCIKKNGTDVTKDYMAVQIFNKNIYLFKDKEFDEELKYDCFGIFKADIELPGIKVTNEEAIVEGKVIKDYIYTETTDDLVPNIVESHYA